MNEDLFNQLIEILVSMDHNLNEIRINLKKIADKDEGLN